MRINRFLAQATGISRRMADRAVEAGRVIINERPAAAGSQVETGDVVMLDGKIITSGVDVMTIKFYKPVGCVVSRDGQGSLTVYDLLPPEYRLLKPIGRLDKNTSGLLLLTNDGDLANKLSHPRYAKTKVYEVSLAKPLAPLHHQMIDEFGIQLEDGVSKLSLQRLEDGDDTGWRVTMQEGRNRQIRRTFAALNYHVSALHRTNFGDYSLDTMVPREIRVLPPHQ